MTNKKRLLFISAHFSTGGMPQVALKKIENLIDHYDIMVIEYADITAGLFTVQKNKIKSLLKPNKFITLGNNKKELISIIENFKPNYIHLEEVPETFMDFDVAKRIYKKDRDYFITETTHNVLFDVSSKKFFPDKFMHVSKYIADKFSILNIPYEVVEYPVEKKERPDRTEALKKLGLDPEYKHVLNVGLFTPGKNQKEVIDTARLIESEKIQFHFVGNQAGNFQGYWEPLMRNIPKNCKVWGERTDVDNFYSCMDLFLFTSTYELNPIVLKEALSYDMKILMYNLEPYAGTYDNNKNVKFLTNDIQTNINKIKNTLFPELAEKIELPKKCYITHTTKNYAETTFGLIYSLLEFSKYPIVIYTINFNINELKNPFKYKDSVIFVEVYDNYYPKDTTWVEKEYGKYVNRNADETYKLLSIKADILLRVFNCGVESGVYLDSDTVCRPNVDNLMLETMNVLNYPLLTRGVYDILLGKNGERDIERPMMDYLNVEKRSMRYVQSNIIVFTSKCYDFIKEWKEVCIDENIVKNFKKMAPFHEETIVNVLLWKYNYTKQLKMHHFNIRNPRFVEEFEKFDTSDISKYSEHMKGFPFYIDGVQMEWSYIPLDKDDIKVFHGVKKLDEMLEIMEYENGVKNENKR